MPCLTPIVYDLLYKLVIYTTPFISQVLYKLAYIDKLITYTHNNFSFYYSNSF